MLDLFQSSQYYSLMGNSVFEAIAAIRDTVAYAEVMRSPPCFLTIDFQGSLTTSPMNTCSRYCVSTASVNVQEKHIEYLQQLNIVGTNKWLQNLPLSNQDLHPTAMTLEHDSVCNVLKPTPMYPRKLSPWSTVGATSCNDLGCSIC